MQNPVDSHGSIFKTSPYQAETELDVKETLFEIYIGYFVSYLGIAVNKSSTREPVP